MMASTTQYRIWVFGTSLLALAILFSPMPGETQSAPAPRFSVIHHFSGEPEGARPYAGLTIDAAGNLYGTTASGGSTGGNCGFGCGTVFKLMQSGPGWTLSTLYNFAGGNDGSGSQARVIFGRDGTLYGTTSAGGSTGGNCDGLGCGTVFNLRPQPRACRSAPCFWTETVLYRFLGGNEDGAEPSYGDLVFDSAGSLYGTTIFGGPGSCGYPTCGTVYRLTPSGGGWTECLVYSFTGLGRNGGNPYGGVIFDNDSNLYGTTAFATFEYDGILFQLTPAGCNATETTLFGFDDPNDGGSPIAGLLTDSSGNLYGTTGDGGPGLGGTVFELEKNLHGWTFKLLYGINGQNLIDQGPFGSLVMDADGSLYGTTIGEGAHNLGSVFKLLPNHDGTWNYQDLHDFNNSDGSYPVGNVTLDANGNIYGTTSAGGQYELGVVWKITQ